MADARLLGDRYELGEELGYGGMAEVYLSRDTRLGRDVAVKVLRADLARDPAFLGRFRREAQSAAGLNHPHIVGVYDTGESEIDGTRVPYIVMEYIAGRTLRDVLAEDGRLLPRRALEITGEICAALEYSHRAGIVHRDIKPANVMLTRAGEVKVMDFGIARAASQTAATMTQTAQVLGTAQYLSPEQARGEHVDGRSDIYSTGCLLYELLTGVPPFQGDSAFAVAYQHVREDPVPPSQLEPDLPRSLDAVVLKAMAKNPANRYQSAADFQADVERAAEGRQVAAEPLLATTATAAIPSPSPTTVLLRPDERDRSGLRRVAYVALAVAVLAVFVIIALLVKNLTSGTTASIPTPNVIGMTQAQAEQTITQAGLKFGPVTTNPTGTDGNTLAAGLVYNQSPIKDIQAKKGTTSVQLFVSTGTQRVVVPNVVGSAETDAAAALKAKGLVVSTREVSVVGTAGQVTNQSVPPGSTVDAGTTVVLTVVSGQQEVPDVFQEPFDQASQTLTQAGFMVTEVMEPDASAAGTVINESPLGGSTQKNGTTVVLTVSTGPPATSSSPPVTTSSGPPVTSSSSSPPPVTTSSSPPG